MKHNLVHHTIILFVLLISVLSNQSLLAQNQDKIWYFGNNAGLNFATNPPTAISNGAINTVEGCSVMADENGALLFSTDGSTVYNKNNSVMTNGSGLNGNTSATQSALIVPWPGTNCKKYFVFTVDAAENSLGKGLNYSIVDFSSNSLGQVTTKNTHLLDSATERIAAITDNNNGFWVLAHGFGLHANDTRATTFYAYHISTGGITGPTTSSIGAKHELCSGTAGNRYIAAQGQLKFSPDGTSVALAVRQTGGFGVNYTLGFVEIFTFDRSTGTVTGLTQHINSFGDGNPYGVAFSPNSNVLYVATAANDNNAELSQFDLTVGPIKVVIATSSLGTVDGYDYGQLQLGTDGKIYLARRGLNRVSVINFPNNTSTVAACGFSDAGITLSLGDFCQVGLPNFIQGTYTCSDSCSLDTLSINTALDHQSNTVYSTNSLDNYWRIVGEPAAASAAFNHNPVPSASNPRPAAIRTPNPAWATAFGNSEWITTDLNADDNYDGDYDFRFKFCLGDTSGYPSLWLQLYTDDDATVSLNGNLIGATPTGPDRCGTNGCNFQTAHTFSSSSYFQPGSNYVDVVVHNRWGVDMGLNLAGYVIGNGASVQKMQCCSDSGAITGYKWLDLNGDGIWQANEPPIGNWPIVLDGSTTVHTDNFGFYYFPSVSPGQHIVTEGNPGYGCSQTSSVAAESVSVSNDQVVMNVNFGNHCDSIGTICITKFNDDNRDGVQDGSEQGIPHWLFNIHGVMTSGGYTDSTGHLCIKVLAGTYTVSEFLDPDWVPTTPYSQTANVGVGQTVNLTFGNVNCPSSDTLIFNTGWNQDNSVTIPTGTIDNDWYVISDPDPNTHETRPAYVIPPYQPNQSWANPQTNSQWISSYPSSTNDRNGPYQFEYHFCLLDSLEASLCMSLRVDDTAAVYLNNHLIGTTGTHSFGYWKPPVVICTANPLFFKAGKNTIRIDLHNTQKVAMGIDAVGTIRGDLPRYYCCCSDSTAGIVGKKWNDLNGDGIWEAGEPTLAKWTIKLSNGMTTTTDSLGNYYFMFLTPGTYTVSEQSQAGWLQTAPSSGSYTLTLNSCQIIDSVNFGNRHQTCVPPPGGMVAWWKFDETSGTTYQDYAGVPNNGTGSNVTTTVGKVNKALSFDGTSSYVQVPDHPELNFGTGNFSFDAWIKTTDTSYVNVLLDKRVTSPDYRGYEVFLYHGVFDAQISDGSSTNYGSGHFVADNQWHHLALTVARNDTAGIKFYVDGSLVKSVSSTAHNGDLTNAGVLRIGDDALNQGSFLKATLDEIELFNRVLTPTEVRSIWQADSLGKCVSVDSCLDFGTISPCKCDCKTVTYNGTITPTSCAGGTESAGQLIFNVDPNSSVTISLAIPTSLANGGTLIPFSGMTAEYSTTGVSGTFTPFNPNVPVTIAAGPTGDIVVRFGGTICPPKNIPGGQYNGVAVLTWQYAGPNRNTDNTLTLCITATILDDRCCIEPPTNMVGWWSFDETSGSTSADLAGYANKGYQQNSPTPVAGKVAGALQFNGANQYLEVANQIEMNIDSSNFTIDAWIKTTDSSGIAYFLDKRSFNPVRGYSFFLINGKLSLQIADASAGSDICSSDPSTSTCTNYGSSVSVADGAWHLVGVTVDRNSSSGIVFYKDGVASPTTYNPTIRSGSLSNTVPLRIGIRSDLTDPYAGIIDELELFKRTLSATEMQAIFLADSLGKCKPGDTYDRAPVGVNIRWNLLSVPVLPDDNTTATLFPNATSTAFGFDSLGYFAATSMDNNHGYWLKFANAGTETVSGNLIFSNSFQLEAGWNIIGSISAPVDVSTSSAIANLTMPVGILSPSIFQYANGYSSATSLDPGKGYWVKAKQAGTMVLNASASLPKSGVPYEMNSYLADLKKLTFMDAGKNQQTLYFGRQPDAQTGSQTFELPPMPPAGVFDVRFASQTMVETYPSTLNDAKEYRLNLSSVSYPLNVSLDMVKNTRETIELDAMIDGKVVKSYPLKNHETISIKTSATEQYALRVSAASIPTVYALHQCYPNPFNPSTTIDFDLPQSSRVTIQVYDVLGRLVTTLLDNQPYEAGTYERVFNANNLASGMYFYRITATSTAAQGAAQPFTDLKKMLLLK